MALRWTLHRSVRYPGHSTGELAHKMGLLTDIRNGDRGGYEGAFAVIFWIIAGAGLGFWIALAPTTPLPPPAAGVLVLVGAVLGSVLGFYAAWGVSWVARVLVIPGVILSFLLAFAS
jgi:hypothetical protein